MNMGSVWQLSPPIKMAIAFWEVIHINPPINDPGGQGVNALGLRQAATEQFGLVFSDTPILEIPLKRLEFC